MTELCQLPRLAFTPSDCDGPLPNPLNSLLFSCCRVSYRAKKYEWMEIFYTNQYGTSDRNYSVFDIVELHRVVKSTQGFLHSKQPDWPKNGKFKKGVYPSGEKFYYSLTHNCYSWGPMIISSQKPCSDSTMNKDF